MNWEQIGTMIGSFVLGIGAVAAVLHKYVPVIKKYLLIANDTIVFLNEVATAIEDDNLSATEWDSIKIKAIKLKVSWTAK